MTHPRAKEQAPTAGDCWLQAQQAQQNLGQEHYPLLLTVTHSLDCKLEIFAFLFVVSVGQCSTTWRSFFCQCYVGDTNDPGVNGGGPWV